MQRQPQPPALQSTNILLRGALQIPEGRRIRGREELIGWRGENLLYNLATFQLSNQKQLTPLRLRLCFYKH